jgi:hypothetical protein
MWSEIQLWDISNLQQFQQSLHERRWLSGNVSFTKSVCSGMHAHTLYAHITVVTNILSLVQPLQVR